MNINNDYLLALKTEIKMLREELERKNALDLMFRALELGIYNPKEEEQAKDFLRKEVSVKKLSQRIK